MAYANYFWAYVPVFLLFAGLARATTKLRPQRAKLLVSWRAFEAPPEMFWR